MMQALSFEQAPPLHVPLRFFLTAPLFGVAAGVVLILQPDLALATRWTAATLAMVHLVAVGFLLNIMAGALFQLMPVAVGANLRGVVPVATLTHGALVVLPVALAAAFLWQWNGAVILAMGLAALLVVVFIPVVLLSLLRTPAGGPTVKVLPWAVLGLGGTLVLGASLLAARQGWLVAGWFSVTPVHVGWGLGVWALGLLAGVAYLVVPMFQLTPPYPPRFAASLGWGLAVVSLGGGVSPWREPLLGVALAILAGVFAALTLNLQRRRRRARLDMTFRMWRLAMVAMLGGAVLTIAALLVDEPRWAVTAGLVIFAGVLLSATVGMLYKIVPFMIWLNLQQRLGRGPNMMQIIPEAGQLRHYRLHCLMLALLLLAPWVEAFRIPAGGLVVAWSLMLLLHLARAVRWYRQACRASQERGAQAP
ncbi:MAG: hypothetical protein RBS40_08305 [Rhodocyclaceae bacterium]|jgi:hypothetical protein|nr:hypothetical protein [Rhodocyclaceae bacterium]